MDFAALALSLSAGSPATFAAVLVAILALGVLTRAMAFPPASTPLVPIRLSRVGLAADDTQADRFKMPFPAEVVAIECGVTKLAGSTPHTDVDVTVKNGSNDLLSARVAAVDASTIQGAGGVAGSLNTTAGRMRLAAGDVLNLDVDITGGSSPLTDVWACVWVQRLNG